MTLKEFDNSFKGYKNYVAYVVTLVFLYALYVSEGSDLAQIVALGGGTVAVIFGILARKAQDA